MSNLHGVCLNRYCGTSDHRQTRALAHNFGDFFHLETLNHLYLKYLGQTNHHHSIAGSAVGVSADIQLHRQRTPHVENVTMSLVDDGLAPVSPASASATRSETGKLDTRNRSQFPENED